MNIRKLTATLIVLSTVITSGIFANPFGIPILFSEEEYKIPFYKANTVSITENFVGDRVGSVVYRYNENGLLMGDKTYNFNYTMENGSIKQIDLTSGGTVFEMRKFTYDRYNKLQEIKLYRRNGWYATYHYGYTPEGYSISLELPENANYINVIGYRMELTYTSPGSGQLKNIRKTQRDARIINNDFIYENGILARIGRHGNTREIENLYQSVIINDRSDIITLKRITQTPYFDTFKTEETEIAIYTYVYR